MEVVSMHTVSKTKGSIAIFPMGREHSVGRIVTRMH